MTKRKVDEDLTTCECGKPLTFDPLSEGTTCGGLAIIGGLVCECGRSYVSKRSREREAWRLASSGRSVETGITRIRAEAGGAADRTEALMRRIVRLPELELALRKIARGVDDPKAVAAAALGETS